MSTTQKWRAIVGLLAGLATLVSIVLIVERWGAELSHINWPLVSLLCVFVFGATMLYRWQDIAVSYDLMDVLMNPKTGKADPYRHLLFLFAGLTAWAIIQVVLAKQWDTLSPLLLGALGFFVAKPALDGFADAFGSRHNDDDDHAHPRDGGDDHDHPHDDGGH